MGPNDLSLSRAARLAGVSRGQIQKAIREGRLITFEGCVRLSDLTRVYPQVQTALDENQELERAERLKEAALSKIQPEQLPETLMQAEEINKLRVRLSDAQAEIRAYKDLVHQLHGRLTDLQEHCTRGQRLMVQALVRWMLSRLDERR